MNPVMQEAVSKRIIIEKTVDNGKAKATVTTNTDGKNEVINFEGTEAEVQSKIDSIK
ncbi:MAG: hypothetical protein H7199_11510 [Burkholderiales bacterium]|nr:hypothetical protein [Flavobacterium sp.]